MPKTNRSNSKRASRGASLIELMLAVVVFVVGSASVAHLFIGARSAALFGIEMNQATLLAKEGIEESRAIRNIDFDDLEEFSDEVTLDGTGFTRNVTLSYDSDEEVLVTSSVEWKSLRGEEEVEVLEILTDWDSGEAEQNENGNND